jgi:L-ascorbate metabolism protein UlaG (beta-lactamase superfamily)
MERCAWAWGHEKEDLLVQVNYIGHATVLVDIGRVRVLTDPLLRDRLFFLRRHGHNPAPALLEQRPPDVVLLSHLHYDHADLPSLRRRPPHTPVRAPKGTGQYLSAWTGVEVCELGEGDSVQVADVEIRAVPAEHGRASDLRPRHACLGYALRNRLSVYFAGDTDLFDGMDEIGQEYDLDLALLPVGGYSPHLGPGHLTPRTAAEALLRLRPRVAVPIHWGSLRYPGPHSLWKQAGYLKSPPRAFYDYASCLAPATDVRVLQPGEWTALH